MVCEFGLAGGLDYVYVVLLSELKWPEQADGNQPSVFLCYSTYSIYFTLILDYFFH